MQYICNVATNFKHTKIDHSKTKYITFITFRGTKWKNIVNLSIIYIADIGYVLYDY